MSAGHIELTGSELTTGVLTGLAMCAVLQPAVLYQNFKPWFKQPNLTPGPSPERYLGASIHTFVAMVITGAVLTNVFSHLDFEHNPISEFYGYNNICVLFDSPPSTYISPIFWFFAAYLIVRYAVEDTKRLVQIKHIGAGLRRTSYGANIALVIAAAAFSLCLAVPPEENMIIHTSPFVVLVLAFPLAFVLRSLQDSNRTQFYLAATCSFMAISILKATFTVIALAQIEGYRHVPAEIAQPVDIIWTLMALSAPFLAPIPKIDPFEKQIA
ncbi:MAG: hypothetical protein ABJH63_05110 [Rhizobiaceae bacterium]